MFRIACCFVAVFILLAIGCQKKELPGTDQTERQVTAEPPSAAEQLVKQSRQEIALAAQRKLFEKLSTRLVQAMSSGGPTAAIPICKKEAPRFAKEVGEELGVAIGRTSFRLRNPQNAVPDWAQDLVEQQVEEQQFVDLPDGRLGSLLPIRLKPQCLACHGPEEQLEENVRATLKREYPNDQATGFRDGDLRGWFWVEVPAEL